MFGERRDAKKARREVRDLLTDEVADAIAVFCKTQTQVEQIASLMRYYRRGRA